MIPFYFCIVIYKFLQHSTKKVIVSYKTSVEVIAVS